MKVGEKYRLRCYPDYNLFGITRSEDIIVEISYIRSGVIFITWNGKEEGIYEESPLAKRLKKVNEAESERHVGDIIKNILEP